MCNCLFCYKPIEIGEYHIPCCKKFFGTTTIPVLPYSLDTIEELAKEIVNQSISVTGVQAKLSLHLTSDSKKDSRFTIVGLWGNFILKPPTNESPHMPEVEDCTMKLTGLFKIPVMPHSLIRLTSGELSYITRRIDRNSKTGSPIHMEDFCQLSRKLTEQKYRGSMEHASKVIRQYSSNALFDLLTYFEVTLFSFLTGNGDMHLKNFSLIHSENGMIALTPAYDLLCTRLFIAEKDDPEELALTLNGKKRKFSREDFISFGKTIGLSEKQIERSFRKFVKAIPLMEPVIRSSFMGESMKDEFLTVIAERARRLGIKE